MTGKVRLEGYMDVPHARIAAVVAALPAHIALTRAEPGCLAFAVEQSDIEAGRFVVSELFTDQAAFDAHQTRAQASDWATVTKGLPRHYTITTDE